MTFVPLRTNVHLPVSSTGWHALSIYMFPSVFIVFAEISRCNLLDSVRRSSYPSRPVHSRAQRSNTILSAPELQKQNSTYRSTMGLINPHCTAKKMNVRPVYLYLSSVILRAASCFRYGLNLRHDRHSEAARGRNWTGFNPHLQDWPLAR